MKIGLISDTHIPRRANKVLEEFLSWFNEEKVDLIIHCGDVTDLEVLKELESIAEVKVVKGNTDYYDFPRELALEVEGWKIYVFHSSEIYPRGDLFKLYRTTLEKGCDILIYGHTHIPLFTQIDGKYFINPGSATGVWSGEIDNPPKSAAILELKQEKIEVKFKIV